MSETHPSALSNRENGILTLTMSGLTDKEIAGATDLSIHTVRTYWDRIREKIGADSRAEAIAKLAAERASGAKDNDTMVLQAIATELDEKRAELASIDARKVELEEIVGRVPQLNWARLPSGEIYYANDRAYQYTGLSADQLINTWDVWEKIVLEEDRIRLEPKRQEVLAGLPLDVEARLRRHDGQYRWHIIRSIPILDESGVEVRRIGTAVDIHDIRERTERSQGVENRLRIICELSPIGISFCDPATKTFYSNHVHDRITGYAMTEETAHLRFEAVHQEDRVRTREGWAKSVRQGVAFHTELRFVHPDGNVVWAQIRAVPLRMGDVEGYVLLVEDMSHMHADSNDREKLLKLAALLEDVLESGVGAIP